MPGEIRDHNVFILGAGFSRDAGAPLIHDFLDRSRELFDNPDSALNEHEHQQFEEVFRFKREVAKAREKFRIDLDNIEQLFGLVEMSHRLGSVEPATRDATVYLIAKTLQLALSDTSRRPEVRFSLKPGYAGQADSFLKYVRRSTGGVDRFETDIYTHFALYLCGKYDDQHKAGSRSNTVITFNYDLVLDDALRRVEADPGYELKDAAYEEVRVGYPVVPLLKLHGSTNWAICGCNKIQVLGEKATANPSTFSSMRCKSCGKVGLRLLLVPPSWDKSEYSGIMQPVWRKAVDAIKTATRICVIGYSMPETDAFFKFLLSLGLAENDHLYKLIVVDWLLNTPSPTENNIEARWRDMLEGVFVNRRFVFHPYGTAQFMQGPLTYLLRRAEQVQLG
jgi:NAD-dependent SIR2 family protein deacetylase